MVVQLQNKEICYVNNIEDLRELVDPGVYEAMKELIEIEVDEWTFNDDNMSIEDGKALNETNKRQYKELKESEYQKYAAQRKIRNALWTFKIMIEDYNKSKSKRVDKEAMLIKLNEVIEKLKGAEE